MKPLILKMKAFGSYAEETIVNFDELDSGLYLITGDTGAGKTTIFDAMVYALYGEASGNDRESAMLHSDFVDKSVDTIVSLEFIHHDKKYRVERKIHYPKNRNGDEYGKPTPSAWLYEEDTNKTIEKSNEVTSRITEIIGLDANQFKQIIVLAQGEFQKFLTASSEERNVILGKLFDNTPYVRFQNRLNEATKKVDKKVEQEVQSIRMKMDSFDYPQTEDKLLYSIENPECIKNIEKLVVKEKEEKTKLDTKYNEVNEQEKALIIKKTTASAQNKELVTLSEYENKYNELLKQKEEKEKLYQKLLVVEKLDREVSPLKKSYEESLTRFNDNEKEIDFTSKQLEQSSKKREVAIDAYRKVNALNTEKTKLDIELNRLKDQLEKFKPFNDKKEEYRVQNNKVKEIQLELDNLKVKQTQLETKKKDIEIKISETKTEANQYADRKIAYDKVNNQYESLTKKDGLIQKISNIDVVNKQVQVLKKEALDLIREVKQKDKIYHDLYSSFLNSQASHLAKDLKIKLESETEANCPVCRHHLTKVDIPNLKIDEDKIVTSEEVDEAKNNLDKANANYNHKTTDVQTKEAEIKSSKDFAVDYAKQIGLNISVYDDLTTEFVSNLKDNLLKEKTEKEKLFNLSSLAKQDLEKLEQEQKETEAKQKKIEELINQKNEEKIQQGNLLTKIETELKTLENELNGLTEETINQNIENTNNKISANDKEIKTLTKNKEDAEKEYSANKGKLETLKNTNDNLKKELEANKLQYLNALNENQLKDEKEYINVISIALPDINKWIKDKRQDYQTYQENLKSSFNLLSEQKEKCKDYQYVELTTIEEELKNKNDELKELTASRDALNKQYDNHQSTLTYIQDKNEIINRYKPAQERLMRLSILANAKNNTDGGKITFDRYVMGNAFGEILQAANQHLAVMASGQFELIHQTKSDKRNGQAGLDISVLDVFTGEQRKPESLSGGEKFQVSMSLALGLTDVVQNHAGGKKIETMYIDEGFGTLDEAVLSKAIEVLNNIAGENRQIGIISHVERLEESIPQKIVVTKSDKGSHLKIVK